MTAMITVIAKWTTKPMEDVSANGARRGRAAGSAGLQIADVQTHAAESGRAGPVGTGGGQLRGDRAPEGKLDGCGGHQKSGGQDVGEARGQYGSGQPCRLGATQG